MDLARTGVFLQETWFLRGNLRRVCIWISRSGWDPAFEELAYHDNIMEIGKGPRAL